MQGSGYLQGYPWAVSDEVSILDGGGYHTAVYLLIIY